MKKSLSLLIIFLLAIPALAAADSDWTYVQIADFVSDREVTCYMDFMLSVSDDSHETLTVQLPDDLPQETLQSIEEQRIALISPVNYITVGSQTELEARSIKPAVYYAVTSPWTRYDEEANSISTYVSDLTDITIDLPDTVNAKALVTEGEERKVIMFAPYALDGELYTRHVYAKEVSYTAMVCGYVTDFGSDYLEVDALPFEDIRNANQDAIPTPMRFALTDNSISVNNLEDGVEIVVVYDEGTTEVLAVFIFHG